MNPVDAIRLLVEVLSNATLPFTEQDLYSAMRQSHVQPAIVNRALDFAQIAACRNHMEGSGLRFSDSYYIFDKEGAVIESGDIAEEPYFIAAKLLITPSVIGEPAFCELLKSSQGFIAIQNAIEKGAKPDNLIWSPEYLLLEPLTEAGQRARDEEIAKHIEAFLDVQCPIRPWWKFW